MIGKFAAIPGGMDIEETYHLIDTYIQECEKLQTEEAVKNLQYNMTIDFAQRVAQQKLPGWDIQGGVLVYAVHRNPYQ